MTPALIFDDAAPALGVLSDLRPIFDVRTGCLTTLQRFDRALARPIAAAVVPDCLADIARESTDLSINQPLPADDLLLLNGRCVLPPDDLNELASNQAIVEPESGNLVAARLSRADAQAYLDTATLPSSVATRPSPAACLLRRPWDVIRFRDEAIRRDLASLLQSTTSPRPSGVLTTGDHAIQIHPTATVFPSVFLDATHGPIVIDQHAAVRPGAIVVGPASLGAHSVILEHALIKSNTAIGPVCKVAGEVGSTIFQSHSNKGHTGHLGDAWIGQWVNLGAGTTNSNLLNTYSEVKAAVDPDSPREKTGLTFFGCLLGDHVKTAIGTRLMTGTVAGTGAMIAATAPPPTAVRRFAWLTDTGEKRYQLDRFFQAAERMMRRREKTLTEPMRQRLTELHNATPGKA